MTVLRANFSSGSVQENPLAAGVTTLTMAGNLQNLPTIVSPDFARLTIDPLGTDGLSGSGTEIVHVTSYAHGAGAATIVRGQEGTTNRPHSQGVKIVNAPTAQDWIDVITQHEAESDPHSQYATDGDLTAEASTRTAAVSAEGAARIAGDNNEATARTAAVSAEGAARIAGDNNEATARTAADSTEASTRATEDKKRPRVIGASGGLVGSSPALSSDFVMQAGSDVLTSSSGGQIHLTYPAAFPTGVLTAQLTSADGAVVIWVQTSLLTTTDLYAKVTDLAGADYVGIVRVNWIVIGW